MSEQGTVGPIWQAGGGSVSGFTPAGHLELRLVDRNSGRRPDGLWITERVIQLEEDGVVQCSLPAYDQAVNEQGQPTGWTWVQEWLYFNLRVGLSNDDEYRIWALSYSGEVLPE